MLPLVGSTIVPPGTSAPDASAASIMRSAMRSFTEPPGFRYSTLASTSHRAPSVTWCSRTSGVSPISSTIESATCTRRSYADTRPVDRLSQRSRRASSPHSSASTAMVAAYAASSPPAGSTTSSLSSGSRSARASDATRSPTGKATRGSSRASSAQRRDLPRRAGQGAAHRADLCGLHRDDHVGIVEVVLGELVRAMRTEGDGVAERLGEGGGGPSGDRLARRRMCPRAGELDRDATLVDGALEQVRRRRRIAPRWRGR